MKKLSVIIPTYNRVDSLRRTFSYIKKSSVLPDELIVVDQSESDYARQIEALCRENEVVYKHLQHPSSTAARNVGIETSSGDILVFMDDDVDVDQETLSNVKEVFCDEGIVLVGGYDKKTVIRNSKLGYVFGKSKKSKRNIGHMASGIYGRFPLVWGKATPTEWAMGFFFAVEKNFIVKHNCKFDENLQYYAYAEDLDFSYGVYLQAERCGRQCILSDRIIVNHNVSNEYRTPTRKATFMSYLHRYYICKKYKLNSVKFWWSNFGDLIYRLLKRESLSDYFGAISFLISNREKIAKGCFLYEKFM